MPQNWWFGCPGSQFFSATGGWFGEESSEKTSQRVWDLADLGQFQGTWSHETCEISLHQGDWDWRPGGEGASWWHVGLLVELWRFKHPSNLSLIRWCMMASWSYVFVWGGWAIDRVTPDDGFASFLLLQDALKHPWICINVPAVPLDLSQVGFEGLEVIDACWVADRWWFLVSKNGPFFPSRCSVTSTLMTSMTFYDSMMGCFEGSLGTVFFHYILGACVLTSCWWFMDLMGIWLHLWLFMTFVPGMCSWVLGSPQWLVNLG